MLGLIARVGVLLVGAAGVGVATNAWRADGVRFDAFSPPTSCQGVTTAASEVLEPGETAHLCGAEGVLIADARPERKFAEGHVAGAIHLPCAASGEAANEAISLLHGKHTVIVYGDTTDEAEPVAEELKRRAAAPLRIVVLKGGFPAWSQAGLACSSGPCPTCEEPPR